MTDHPILMSAPMVRALLREIEQPGSGKTMTRRPAWGAEIECPKCEGLGVVPEIHDGGAEPPCHPCRGSGTLRKPTIWQKVRPGDRRWVRENHAFVGGGDPGLMLCEADWRETAEKHGCENAYTRPKWTPNIHMFKEHSRITLVVTATRMERVQAISEADARAEGVRSIYGEPFRPDSPMTDRRRFQLLWDTLHPKPSHRWEDNPECVAVSFVPHLCNIDTMNIPRD